MHKKGLQKSNRRLILFEVLKKNPKWFLTNPQTTILAMYWGAAYSNQLMHSLERKSTLCPSPPPLNFVFILNSKYLRRIILNDTSQNKMNLKMSKGLLVLLIKFTIHVTYPM